MRKLLDYLTGTQRTDTPTQPKTGAMASNKINIKTTNRRLAPINSAPQENIYDSLAFVIHCAQHNNLAVFTTEHIGATSAVWLPFIYLSPFVGWSEAIDDGLALILSDNDNAVFEQLKNKRKWDSCILQILRIQLPHTQRYITRLICLVKLHKSKTFKCCQNTSRISWISLDLTKSVDKVWGQELRFYSLKVNVNMTAPDSYLTQLEHDLEWVLMYVPRDPPRNQEEYLLKKLSISEKNIERVYIDFVEHCFPAYLMSFHSFKNYFTKYGFVWDDSRMERYFIAFNLSQSGYINFHELLLGIACIEPDIYNTESRSKFVFRFYDVDRDGFLNTNEFTSLITDMCKTEENCVTNENVIKEKVKEGMKSLNASSNGVAFKDFITAVGSAKFPDTSDLCKSQVSIFRGILNVMASRGVKANTELKNAVIQHLNKKKYDGVCNNCRKTRYELAAHTVKLGENGKCIDYQLLPSHILKNRVISPTKNPFLSEKYSMEMIFKTDSLANYLIDKIRAFNAIKGDRNNPKGLFDETKESREVFVKMLKQLANEVIPIFESEDRCVKVRSPAVVIGDIHGNLADLLSIEKYLFKTVPIVAAKYVFLGDYVDRGKWSVECAAYVLCLKLLAPTNFFLLRGNHETRQMNEHYSFRKETQKKYRSYGEAVFDIFNKIFDNLPLCAVIDDSIFCAHGGIPASVSTITEIDKIKKNLKNPVKECNAAMEMIWNDPVDDQEFKKTANLQKKGEGISRGFVLNSRRGVCYYFNAFACQEFLKTNGLSHVIRAHEVPRLGFKFHFEQKCLTIFSCSHYQGTNNKAAAVFIVDETIRIAELDTVSNPPATDDNNRHRNSF